jgi:hypothetical protein
MTTQSKPGSDKFSAKDYLALAFSALALVVSAAGFYVQFIEKSYALYVGISGVQVSLSPPARPTATFLFANRGNQPAIILELSANIYPASDSFSTDNCRLPQMQRVASLLWTNLSSASGTLMASPILLKPADITAYKATFSDLSKDDIARAVATSHGNKFLLLCWVASYYSKTGFIIIQHFAATVTRFDELNEVQEQRTPTSLLLLQQ